MEKSTDRGSNEKKGARDLDLSELQNFNFASNWSESTPSTGRSDREGRSSGGQPRERGPDRRSGGGGRDSRPRESGGRDRRPPVDRGDRRRSEQAPRREDRPDLLLRESPFEIQLIPEESILTTLTNAMRHSLRTYELFEISRLILEKPDRFEIGLRYHGQAQGQLLYQSAPDGVPFLSEEAAVDHVFRTHLDRFFSIEEVEVEAPKGSFQFIARCTLTGEFLSPPNYHRYQSILMQHHQEKFPGMPFERFRAQVETVKDEEAIEKWMLGMKKQTHYRTLPGVGSEEQTFTSPEEARAFLSRELKDKVVRAAKMIRFSGKQIEALQGPEIRPYIVAYLEHQKRFPLDTANTMRGRLRRQHFFIYKKGSRGISFVCAVKRKFRQPGQVFSDTVQALITFLEQNDQIHASELTEKFLGLTVPEEGDSKTLDPADHEKIKRLSMDLRWLLSEGYVTEFSDGRLSVHGVMPAGQDEQKPREPKTKSGPKQDLEKKAADVPPAPAVEEKSSESGADTQVSGEETMNGANSGDANPVDVQREAIPTEDNSPAEVSVEQPSAPATAGKQTSVEPQSDEEGEEHEASPDESPEVEEEIGSENVSSAHGENKPSGSS